MLSGIMLNVIMLSVVMLNVAAPKSTFNLGNSDDSVEECEKIYEKHQRPQVCSPALANFFAFNIYFTQA
jgi:hypothetical protein